MHDRIVALEGVRNFRDFGGWETPRGALLRGHLWRSAELSEASSADAAALDALGIVTICDLRHPEERERSPSLWHGGARVISNDAGRNVSPPHLAFLRESDLSVAAVEQFMQRLYSDFPFEPRYVALFRDYFAHLVEDGGKSLVHCAAGKDRTGVLCALTLTALGVCEGDVFADYEFTNVAVDLSHKLPEMQARFSAYTGRDIDADAMRPALGVKADYLHAAFASVRERAGSIDAYLTTILGVDERGRARMGESLSA